ncbi:MAG: phage major capsid protein [Methanobrevibacter sp.]|nr:phage major capsid protein [Methanobrevibacter sp.]
MAFNNEQVLSQIVNPAEKAVFKSMREDMETGKAVLNPQQLGMFLRAASLNQTILQDATFDILASFEKQYVETGINGRVLQPGYKVDGQGKKSTNDELDAADVGFDVTILETTKIKTMCSIEDDEKEDNIEKEQFEQTLLTMMGERAGEDLEVWALYSDTDEYEPSTLLGTADGWLKRSPQQLQSAAQYAETNTGKADFDPTSGTVEAIFDAAIYAMPLRFRQRNKLKFYVPFEIEDAYRNLLKSRGTQLGDSTQTGYAPTLTYKGIPIVNCQSFDDELLRDNMTTTNVFLADPTQLLYGIWKNMSIEPDRVVKHERTDYYYRLRPGVNTKFGGKPTVNCTLTLDELADLPDASKI